MKTDMANAEQGEFSGSLRAPNRGKNSDRSPKDSQRPSTSAQARDDGNSVEPNPANLNWLLSLLQSDLGEIKDFGGTVRLFDDPNGLIIQLPNVAICKSHKMMHFGTTCPMC